MGRGGGGGGRAPSAGQVGDGQKPMSGHPMDRMTREEQERWLAERAFPGERQQAEKIDRYLNDLRKVKTPNEAAIVSNVVAQIDKQRAENPHQRLTTQQVYERLRKDKPRLTIRQFQAAMVRAQDSGTIRVAPYTQAATTVSSPQHVIPNHGGLGYYLERR